MSANNPRVNGPEPSGAVDSSPFPFRHPATWQFTCVILKSSRLPVADAGDAGIGRADREMLWCWQRWLPGHDRLALDSQLLRVRRRFGTRQITPLSSKAETEFKRPVLP